MSASGNPAAPPPPPPPSPYKSEGTTMVLAIVLGLLGLNGIGHIYVGKTLMGIGICIGSILLFYVGFIGVLVASIAAFSFDGYIGGVIALLLAYIGLFGWQIVNAKKLCREYNAYYQQNNRPPW